jgi:hypothetical protein
MTHRSRAARQLVTFLALLPTATAVLGAPDRATAPWPPPADRVRYPAELKVPAEAAIQEAVRAVHPGIDEFLKRHARWRATIDPSTGSVDRAFGDGIAGASVEIGAGRETTARRFIADHSPLWAQGLDTSALSLVVPVGGSIDLPDTEAGVVRFDLWQHGLPVLGAGMSLAVRGGRVFYLSTDALAPVLASPSPRIDAAAAVARVAAFAGVEGSLGAVREPSLAFLPAAGGDAGRLRHHLVWVLEVRPPGSRPWEGYVAHVDAHAGDVLAFYPEARECDGRGAVTGGVRPNRADEPETEIPLPFVTVDVAGALVSTDLNGRFAYAGGAAASQLDGDLFRITCDACTGPAQPFAAADAAGDVRFGVGGASQPTPVAGNGASTPADRTTYFHLVETRRLLQKWNSAPFGEVEGFVNIDSACNAFSSGYMLGFFRAGSGCNNTGEIRDVIGHELGHTWDRTDGTGIANGGLSEWKGDLMALLLGGDSCIGESFRQAGGPTAGCSGVRDIDEKAAGRTDKPLTPAVCPTCATITRTANPCGGGVHCTGEITGQAVWHLYQNLLAGSDYITGAPLAAGNPALSTEQARFVLERILVGGGASMRTWDPTAAGTSVYDAALLADDDDGNLANGTPHAAYINAAFAHHEIAETPPVADAPNCAAPADPAVTATLERDDVTGLPRVRLEWTPADATTIFDVYRNARPGDAFLPIAQGVAAGPVFDAGVPTGASYRYFVAAVRKTGCAAVSPGTNVVTLAAALPDVRVDAVTFLESPGAADRDGLLEPGERAFLQVTLRETGGLAGAANVTATLAAGDPVSAPVVAAGPVSFGNLPAGGSTVGAPVFEVYIGASLPCGARVRFPLAIQDAGGCRIDAFELELAKASAGCAARDGAFVEVVPGSAAVAAATGDGDGIADNCEASTVTFQVRNAGTTASGPAIATASTALPGVTFAPAPACAWPDLAPGQTESCSFGFSLGGATTAGVPFVVTADSVANPAPSSHAFAVPAETDPPAFGTVTYNFDTGFQGWSVQGFSLALRSVSPPRSLKAGSTAVNNLCSKATSPALRLSPTTPATLSLSLYGDIEPFTDQWYDRANVHLIDEATHQHVILTPTTGLPYNAAGTPDGGLCHVPGQPGWAGLFNTWTVVTFDLSPWQGRVIRLELNYNSDEGDDRDGVYFDDVRLTEAAPAALPADIQPDACAVPEVSPPGAAVPFAMRRLPTDGIGWTWGDLGAGFQYNVYAGSLGSFYGHGANAVACQSLGAGINCDGGSCGLEAPASVLPAGDLYFLVTAAAFGIEGTAGQGAAGERDPLQSTCAP